MPITFEQAKALTGTMSRYGCGADFALPYANGELIECDSCGWEGN